jgi:hypothetical protein
MQCCLRVSSWRLVQMALGTVRRVRHPGQQSLRRLESKWEKAAMTTGSLALQDTPEFIAPADGFHENSPCQQDIRMPCW